MRNKAQTAMEYLMTYGWAILIVIVVVAALYSMGVFTISPGIACSPCFPSGGDIAYEDHSADSLVVRVGPRELEDLVVTVDATDVTHLAAVDPGDTVTFTSTGLFEGDVEVSLAYNVTLTGLRHTVEATLHGAA